MKSLMKLASLLLLVCFLFCGCSKIVGNELLTISHNEKPINGEYSGSMSFGNPKGNGIFKSTDGWSFEGEFKGKEIPEFGKVKDYPITAEFQGKNFEGKYSGDVKNLIPDGEGIFENDGDGIFKYSGTWTNGKISGKGTLDYDNYLVKFPHVDRYGHYKGEIYDGMASGQGDFTATNDQGISYTLTGSFENGVPHGQAKCNFGEQIQEGTYTNGAFTPNLIEGIKSFSSFKELRFSLTDKELSFINKNEKLFNKPNSDLASVKKLTDQNITYKDFSKEPSKYQGKIIRLKNYETVQVDVLDFYETNQKYMCIIADNSNYDNVVYLYALGDISKIKSHINEGSILDYYFTPIDTSAYENISGGHTNCIVGLICGIE